QPLHLQHGRAAHVRGAGARWAERHFELYRSGSPGAGPDGDRDRLCHDGAVPRGAARLPRPHRHRPCGWTRALMIEGLLQHLPIVPILLPLFAGAALVVVENKTAKTAISVAATTVLLA